MNGKMQDDNLKPTVAGSAGGRAKAEATKGTKPARAPRRAGKGPGERPLDVGDREVVEEQLSNYDEEYPLESYIDELTGWWSDAWTGTSDRYEGGRRPKVPGLDV